jgi:sterol desaturase/sphingolipid hydroxylase (fatty acid hydroxylase superfamily)
MRSVMIGFPIGLLYCNAGEWFIHKYVLHGAERGKKKGTFWSFHFHEHHRNARKHEFHDPDYARSLFGWHAQTKETLGVAMLAIVHLPLLPVFPFFASAVVFSAANYYRIHKRAHRDPEWAKKHVPWHYDHHMGVNQDCNWGVTSPLFDHLFGTREPFLGTEEELRRSTKKPRAASPAGSSLEPAVPVAP